MTPRQFAQSRLIVNYTLLVQVGEMTIEEVPEVITFNDQSTLPIRSEVQINLAKEEIKTIEASV